MPLFSEDTAGDLSVRVERMWWLRETAPPLRLHIAEVTPEDLPKAKNTGDLRSRD